MSAASAALAFAELDRQIACHPEVQASEKLDATRLRIKLKEMAHGPVKFAGDYTLRFEVAGSAVRWTSEAGGNITVRGEATFSDAPGGCRMQFRESVEMDMEVNRLLAGVVRPIAETMMARGMRGFVERMAASLGG